MARYAIKVTDNFIEEAACIEHPRMAARIEMITESLCGNPAMGKRCKNPAVVELYGRDVYVYAAALYEVLYHFDGSSVEMLGITLAPPQQ